MNELNFIKKYVKSYFETPALLLSGKSLFFTQSLGNCNTILATCVDSALEGVGNKVVLKVITSYH